MLLSISLRNSFAKIISGVSKNWAHQTNLILNYGGFCEIFSQNARNIHAESVSIRKFLRWVLLASERAPASPTSTASPLARASPFTATLQNPRCRESITFPVRKFFRSDVERIKRICAVGAVLHNIGCTRHSLSKLRSALVGTIFRGGLLLILQVFHRLCLFGNRCGRGHNLKSFITNC